MFLKIFYEKNDVLTNEIINNFHLAGYKMQLVCVGKFKERNDLFSFYSRPLDGDHIQICLCNPNRVLKNFIASKMIIYLFPDYVYKESDRKILEDMDMILSPNPLIIEKLRKMGFKKINNMYCFSDKLNIVKSETKNYTFLFHSNWLEERGWKEMLFAYCNEFFDGSADIIISTNEDASIVNRDINRFLSLNNFNRDKFDGIYVVSGNNLEDILKFSDCFVAPYLTDYYDNNILTAMRCKIPVIISRLDSYQFICKKNTCWIVNFINGDSLDTIQMGNSMRKIIEDKNSSIRKSDMAYSFIENNLSKIDGGFNIFDLLNSFGASIVSDLNIKLEKGGNVI